MEAREDKNGMDRSVLSYIDVALQPESKYYLVLDEGMGQKVLFRVDGVVVHEFAVDAWRYGPGDDELVVTFSPQLPWRLINANIAYLQDSKTIFEREMTEQREAHDLTKELRKRLMPPDENEKEEKSGEKFPGQYA